jgi:hypothetical protein
MGRFTRWGSVSFLLWERPFDFVGVARGSIAITEQGYSIRGGLSMQAPILCPANICGIRSNPEGYDGAYPAPGPCSIWKWCVAGRRGFSLEQGFSSGAALTPGRTGRLLNLPLGNSRLAKTE